MKLKKSLAITFTDKEVDLLLKIRKDIQKLVFMSIVMRANLMPQYFVERMLTTITKN